MIRDFFPYEYKKSVFDIEYEKLFELGYRALLFDLDNTLVHHGDPANPEIVDFFAKLRAIGLKTIIISDNDCERTETFAKCVGCQCICEAGKPDVKPFLSALEILGVKNSESIVIGDQIFKDILGANRSGILSVMVKYIKVPGEKWPGFRRIAEYLILSVYRLTKYNHRLENLKDERE